MQISRRHLFGMAAGAAVVAALPPTPAIAMGAAPLWGSGIAQSGGDLSAIELLEQNRLLTVTMNKAPLYLFGETSTEIWLPREYPDA